MDTLWYALRNVFNIIKIKKNNQLPPYVIMITVSEPRDLIQKTPHKFSSLSGLWGAWHEDTKMKEHLILPLNCMFRIDQIQRLWNFSEHQKCVYCKNHTFHSHSALNIFLEITIIHYKVWVNNFPRRYFEVLLFY